jgi:hypothetical protein
MIPQDFPSCYHSSMRHFVVLFILRLAKTKSPFEINNIKKRM